LVFIFLLDGIPDDGLVAENLAKSSHILACETSIHFAIFAEFAVHQVK
jgi:hypothetical protein